MKWWKTWVGAVAGGAVGWLGTACVFTSTDWAPNLMNRLRAGSDAERTFGYAQERATSACTLSATVPAHVALDLIMLDDRGGSVSGAILDDRLLLEIDGQGGAGTLHLPGYAPAALSWDPGTVDAPGACAPSPVSLTPATATVSGQLTLGDRVGDLGGDGSAIVDIVGCGGATRLFVRDGRLRGGDRFTFGATPGPCTLQAADVDWHRGRPYVAARSAPQAVVVPASGDVAVALTLERADDRAVDAEIDALGARAQFGLSTPETPPIQLTLGGTPATLAEIEGRVAEALGRPVPLGVGRQETRTRAPDGRGVSREIALEVVPRARLADADWVRTRARTSGWFPVQVGETPDAPPAADAE